MSALPFGAVTDLGLGGLTQAPQSGVSGGTAATGAFFSSGAMATPDSGLNVSAGVGASNNILILAAASLLIFGLLKGRK
tara:strand:+ start:247 stop:483 length:237 start_codon:yes stop_codon:yes gene_type:complete